MAKGYWIPHIDVSDPEGGTPFAFFNFNLMKEVQLVALGAPAEYGGFTDANGEYRFWSIKPTFYPVPDDGPVGDMLRRMGRMHWGRGRRGGPCRGPGSARRSMALVRRAHRARGGGPPINS